MTRVLPRRVLHSLQNVSLQHPATVRCRPWLQVSPDTGEVSFDPQDHVLVPSAMFAEVTIQYTIGNRRGPCGKLGLLWVKIPYARKYPLHTVLSEVVGIHPARGNIFVGQFVYHVLRSEEQ